MRSLVAPVSLALVLGACAGEPSTGPNLRSPPDLRGYAFRLTLDLAGGTVHASTPGRSSGRVAAGSAVSLSLLGDDAISVESPTGVACEPTRNPTQKLCTFDLEVTNDLGATDLTTPTSFPRPPAGTSGILVFPFTASSDGTGGWAFPSADWDLGPVNFFNDLDSCSSGGKTDCYRYELIAAPLYSRQPAYLARVGFVVPVDAQESTAYVVVAADLRDNPWVTVTLRALDEVVLPDPDLCGMIDGSGQVYHTSRIRIAAADPVTGFRSVGFCAFSRALLPNVPLEIHDAELRLDRWTDGSPGMGGTFFAELLDYGPTLDATDYALPTPPAPLVFQTCCFFQGRYVTGVTAGVQSAMDQGLPYVPFRLTPYQTEWVGILGAGGPFGTEPQLVVTYRLR